MCLSGFLEYSALVRDPGGSKLIKPVAETCHVEQARRKFCPPPPCQPGIRTFSVRDVGMWHVRAHYSDFFRCARHAGHEGLMQDATPSCAHNNDRP